MGSEHGGFGQNQKSIKKVRLLLVPFLGVVLLFKFALFVSQRAMVTNKDDKKATQQHHELVVPQSVLVLPHMGRDYRSNPIVKHLYEDGLDQSSVLLKSTSNLDANLVWIVDSQALASTPQGRKLNSSNSSEDWCEELSKKVQQVQKERRQANLSNIVWSIHFVDNKDKNVLHRCKLVESLMGMENVFYHQRAVVTERHFDPAHEWVELGKRLVPPDNIHFVHKPIGVRTDVVQSLEDVLQSKSLSMRDAIESIPRNVDLCYFWEYDTTGRLEGVRLRNVVYRALQNLQQEHGDEYRFRLGLTGDRGRAGREDASPSYVEALLDSKIVVVAQRDLWEDHYRLMEALVSGPLVMTDKMLSLPEGLKGVSLVEYTSADDLQQKVKYYLQNEQERIQIAGHGRLVAMSRYRSWHQLEEIVFGHVVTSCTTNDDCMSVHATQRSPPIDKQSGQRLGGPVTENTKDRQRQLLICGGRGSTATKTLFEATCRLGIPSVHWKMQCAPKVPSIQDGVDAHRRLTQVFMSMAFCLDGSIPCPDAGMWRRQIMGHVDKIVHSGVGALHDTPYPSIMSYLLQSAQKNHVVPIIVLSERDPNDWMRSRSMPQKKYCGMDVICKERFTGDGGPFDVFSCMDRALQRLGETDQYSLLNFSNIFTTVRSLADSGNSDHIVFAMKEYQNWLRPRANFTINVFEKTSKRVTTDGLATEISDTLSIDDLQVAKGTKLRITREDFRISNNDFKTLDKEGSTLETSSLQLRQQPLLDALSRSFFLFLVILAFSLRICVAGGTGIARFFKKRTDGQPGKDKSR